MQRIAGNRCYWPTIEVTRHRVFMIATHRRILLKTWDLQHNKRKAKPMSKVSGMELEPKGKTVDDNWGFMLCIFVNHAYIFVSMDVYMFVWMNILITSQICRIMALSMISLVRSATLCDIKTFTNTLYNITQFLCRSCTVLEGFLDQPAFEIKDQYTVIEEMQP